MATSVWPWGEEEEEALAAILGCVCPSRGPTPGRKLNCLLQHESLQGPGRGLTEGRTVGTRTALARGGGEAALEEWQGGSLPFRLAGVPWQPQPSLSSSHPCLQPQTPTPASWWLALPCPCLQSPDCPLPRGRGTLRLSAYHPPNLYFQCPPPPQEKECASQAGQGHGGINLHSLGPQRGSGWLCILLNMGIIWSSEKKMGSHWEA